MTSKMLESESKNIAHEKVTPQKSQKLFVRDKSPSARELET